tara:strand:- start:1278 stop:1496 length:219 start_codon:yes stop_codon:yes gene_type:complete
MSVDDYINQLSEQEKQVFDIAKDHLKDSFDIERSIGFTEWKKKQEPAPALEPTQKPKIIKKLRLKIKKKKPT